MDLFNNKNSSHSLICFSPQVMILTFVLEILLLVYVVLKFGTKTTSLKLISAILFMLAYFQLAEYGVCEDFGLTETIWAKTGFISITLLPALGVHLVQNVTKAKNLILTKLGYLSAGLLSISFVVFNSFANIGCSGNYAIFDLTNIIGTLFAAYYYLFMLIAIVLSMMAYRHERSKTTKEFLKALVLGYSSFIVPATIIHFVVAQSQYGLPSIMCGFALIFAIVLGIYLAPRAPTE